MQWNIARDGQIKGPYSTQDVLALAQGSPGMLVCKVGESDWVPVAQHPTFVAALQPQPPPLPPVGGIQYDPVTAMTFAGKLYTQATSVVFLCTTFGLILGFAAGVSGAREVGIIALIFTAIGGGLGYAIGDRRALMLRVQAQLLLGQVQIDAHVRTIRTATEGRRSMPPPPPRRVA